MIALSDLCDVSRETEERLRAFEALLGKWTRRINLISASSVDQIWERHILDSVQVWPAAPPTDHWVDLGSGGGLPGIVVAILAKGEGAETLFTLVESDQRKGTFLRTVARELELPRISVVPGRIESLDPLNAGIVSARALSGLPTLLPMVTRHLRPDGTAILPKGEAVDAEIEEAKRNWRFEIDRIASRTNENACLLRLERIERA